MNSQNENNPDIFIIPSNIEMENWIECLQPDKQQSDKRVIIFTENFNDGRIFSLGKQIRIAGYAGDLIAAGDFLPDQFNNLALCGFNHYLPLKKAPDRIDETDLINLTVLSEQGELGYHSYYISA